ncbi:3-hydroxyacyl-CoA dehydrogenase/enoyl-CoA hydratase family protein [Tistrella bauzanensis]|uniref:3-hydroxyacyl-CoA dehydrogenase/enoyl-CoA hydratase family protein n=1 Tax=Tistrella arctica TaxID=3133430 RepID=A0ABU9YPW1_9PROT
MTEINKVAVIGAGVMGAGIAAHIANAGVPVVLLDIVPKGAANRNALAEGAVQKMLKTKPKSFMHPSRARLVTTGNLDDNLDLLADVDWIVEAVIENVEIKRRLYATLDGVRKAGSIVSSNTSTIPLGHLVEGQSAAFKADFLITHFFNPPRYMRLLELVAGPETRADAVETMRRFGDHRLGKGVVDCKDTPGFIANRIGTFWMQGAVVEAMDRGLDIEAVDALLSKPVGIPKTGVFGLIDLVGLDLMPHVAASMKATLPADDAYHAIYRDSDLFKKMIAEGYTGRKGKGGFYRRRKDGGRSITEAIDLATGEYRAKRKPDLASIKAGAKDLRALVSHEDEGGSYAWAVVSQALVYTADLVGTIADEVPAIDEAMRLGYAWKYGPFELIDRLGAGWFADRLKAEGRRVPAIVEAVAGNGTGSFYRVNDGVVEYASLAGGYAPVPIPDGVLRLSDVKRRGKRVDGNGSASLWDIGDGVLCLEFHTKMNSIDPGVLEIAAKSTEIVRGGYKALVIYNEADNFSVGANVGLALFASNIAAWDMIDGMIRMGQETYKALKYAPFPVVGAPAGMALGGGCEILLHCDAVQAHAETYMGLVEVGVGVVPGWGGCKELLVRWMNNKRRPGGPMPAVAQVFEMVSTAKVSESAEEARDLLLLRDGDRITMNRDRVLADAKARALEMVAGYEKPLPAEISLPGPTARVALNMAVEGFHMQGKATPHDVVVSGALARVLSGGDTDITETLREDDITRLEREAFVSLLKTPATLARIEHMLETGKPLRN